MKFVTRYRGIMITRWSGQYYIGPNPENRNPLFHCDSLQDVIDFIDHLSPKPTARGLFRPKSKEHDMSKFDFNCHNLVEGSKIISSKGNVLYTVTKACVPEWETPDSRYENDGLWIQVLDIEGQQWAQPVQWFNAFIGANDGMHVQ